MTDISIVMPVRNGAATIAAQLDALERAIGPNPDVEVIVADNGSTDETAAIARSYEGRLPIRVIEASDAHGPGVARNRGVAQARGRWLLFCDADDEVDVGWVAAMTRAFEAGHELLAGPIDYRRLNDPSTRAWRGADRAGVQSVLRFLPAGHTAGFGMTRQLFDVLGGFDESFSHGEDIELAWRAQLAGHPLTEVADAIVHYRLRASLPGLWRQALDYGTCEAHLHRRFRDAGVTRRSGRLVLGEVWWLVSRLPFALPRGRRGAWLRRLGQQVGRLRGAWRYRTWWW